MIIRSRPRATIVASVGWVERSETHREAWWAECSEAHPTDASYQKTRGPMIFPWKERSIDPRVSRLQLFRFFEVSGPSTTAERTVDALPLWTDTGHVTVAVGSPQQIVAALDGTASHGGIQFAGR